MKLQRILLVDDEPAILQALGRSLRHGLREGLWPALKVEAFSDPAAALARAGEQRFDLALSDYRMPGLNGVQLLSRLRELQPDCQRVILSGHAEQAGLLGAINEARIARFFTKPWDEAELLQGLRHLLQEGEERRRTERLAELQRLALGQISPQEAERRRLERLEPGITQARWSSDGAFILEPLDGGAAA